MPNKPTTSTEHLTFSQRYGYEALPGPMQLEKLSDTLRREIWGATREFLITFRRTSNRGGFRFTDEAIYRFVENILGRHLGLPHDEIQINYFEIEKQFKEILLKAKFNKVLDLIGNITNQPYERIKSSGDGVIPWQKREKFNDSREKLINTYQRQFEEQAAAYWLDTSIRPYKFLPRSSMEQGYAVQQVLKTIEEGNIPGASAHLRKATEHINARQYADSIADSIHAVESVARQISPKETKTLGPALKSLENAGAINHPALKEAFSKLYGYTNDEQGIRHALLDKGSAEVGLDEAVFMFGACASFVAYLVNKHRQMEQQQGSAE